MVARCDCTHFACGGRSHTRQLHLRNGVSDVALPGDRVRRRLVIGRAGRNVGKCHKRNCPHAGSHIHWHLDRPFCCDRIIGSAPPGRSGKTQFLLPEKLGPLAGGVTLLVFPGFSEGRTDIMAHIRGFAAGIGGGWALVT